MVDAGGKKVFIKSLTQGTRENSCISVSYQSAIRQWVQLEERNNIRVYCHRPGRELSESGSRRWHSDHTGNTLQATDALVIGEEECLVLDDRPAEGTAELIAPKRWLLSTVKEVSRIQRVVAEEFTGRAMNRV